MKTQLIARNLIYALLIFLSLAALLLVLNAPPEFLNVQVVYKGF
jgi:hypothetical protein